MFSIFAALFTLGGLVNAQGYVSVPFTKEILNGNGTTNTPLQRRAVLGYLENHYLAYIVSFSLGNNQAQKGILDTGSSDLWVYSSQTSAQYTYNPSGAQLINNNFEMSYLDGSSAQGGYYKDQLTLGGVTVDAQFGVSNTYSGYPQWGWFGIGRLQGESSYNQGFGTYDNYPYALKNGGKIETAAYSLNLNSKDANYGTVLFGAVDSSRYTGKFQLLNGQADSFFGVQFGVAGTTLVGMLDSGTSYTFLPADVVYNIANSLGAQWDDNSQSYLLYQQPSGQGLTYTFGGTQVTVPPSELFQQFNQYGTYRLTVFPTSQSRNRIILGDSFLRSAYTAYDLENNVVAIAQANWSDSSPNYQLITSAGIPGASY